MARIQHARIEHPILIVDDDPIERDILRDFLQSEEIRSPAQKAGLGGAGMAAAARSLAGMVLLDLIMPRVNALNCWFALPAPSVWPGCQSCCFTESGAPERRRRLTAMREFVSRIQAGREMMCWRA